jgi:hypothetical protein
MGLRLAHFGATLSSLERPVPLESRFCGSGFDP